MPREILVICHANTCRSVIAAALLERMLRERGLDGRIRVRSAGVAPYARTGALVSLDARLVLRDEGIDLSPESTSTALRTHPHWLDQADLILAMTEEQIALLRAAFPQATGKPTFTLRAFAGFEGDIADPYDRDQTAYAACRDDIKACLARTVERLL